MASSCAPDVWGWLISLPPLLQSDQINTVSLPFYSLDEPTQPSLNFSILTNLNNKTPCVSFTISADYNIPIPLWTSDSFHLRTKSIDDETILQLFFNVINMVLKYGHKKNISLTTISAIRVEDDFKEVFNLAILALAFLVCVYEAPRELRSRYTEALRVQLASSSSRGALKKLVRNLGSNLEVMWMRSMNLAMTNWIGEFRGSKKSFQSPSPLFCYGLSASGLWKVQLYCPTIAMSVEDPSTVIHDKYLLFSLNYQEIEAVMQFTYKVIFRDSWIEVVVKVDNIRCDVSPLVSETLMSKRGYGSEEKHFPSRISLQLTPTIQTDVLSISVSKSSENPEVGLEKGFEGSFEPTSTLGLTVSASEAITLRMKPWKFEQSVYGNSATLNLFLHDGVNGREVFSTKPSKLKLLQPRAWFRNRYSGAYRPFTRQGGVVFAGDEYGESVCWRVSGAAEGKDMEWEIKGQVWLTYWPHKLRSFHSETRRLEFREVLQIPLVRIG